MLMCSAHWRGDLVVQGLLVICMCIYTVGSVMGSVDKCPDY